MGKLVTRTVADVSSQAASAAIRVSDLDVSAWWVQGTFVGTVDLQESVDGVTWLDVSGESTTTPAKLAIPSTAVFARINVSAYTSGDVESVLSGRDNDLKK